MKINKIVFSNAIATTSILIWLVCTLGILIFPNESLNISKLFLHGLNISVMGTWKVTLQDFLVAGLILASFSWISAYVFIFLLELFQKTSRP